MSDASDTIAASGTGDAPRLYDRRSLTYSNTFDSPAKRAAIRAVEWLTAKPAILRRIRAFERRGVPKGQAFWAATMEVMGVDILTPPEEIARIPAAGPVVLVANHPHGLVDGMVLADLIGRRRADYRILTRSILTGIDESAASYMIPVPFLHEEDAQARMLAMRAAAARHLKGGGLLALFPAGAVASAERAFGPAVEGEWSLFTAKLIRQAGASVMPCYFPGRNSRAYQLASRISPTLRQGLLLHEVVHAFDRPQRPVLGAPIPPDAMAGQSPRELMAWLRERTLALEGTVSDARPVRA